MQLPRSVAVALACAVAACGASPMPPLGSPRSAVEWHVSQALWGSETFVIGHDGEAVYRYEPASGRDQPAESASGKVDASDLQRVRAVLLQNGFCALRSKRDGVPDEGMPTLRVLLPGIGCAVQLWDGEWEDDPRARACAEAVERLRERIRHGE
jgi:hypothetical protein